MEQNSGQKQQQPLDYDAFRAQIQHEGNSLNQKLTWHLMVQSFFFGAYVSLVNSDIDHLPKASENLHGLLIWLVPMMALAASVLIYPSVIVTTLYISQLVKTFREKVPSERQAEPPLHGNPTLDFLSRMANLVLPLLIMSSWVLILAFQIRKPKL